MPRATPLRDGPGPALTLHFDGAALPADPRDTVASALIAAGVIAIALPVGTAAALVLTSLHARVRGVLYGVMVSPLLTPGVVIGISTLVLWRTVGVGGGLFLIIVAQASFITAYVMLMVLARLQRFDPVQEEAAIVLGASRWLTFRRVLMPYLSPALLSAGFLAFLQSFENYNTTLFVRGLETTLTATDGVDGFLQLA